MPSPGVACPRQQVEDTPTHPAPCVTKWSGTIMVRKYIVGYGRKRQNGPCPVEKGRPEEGKAVRNRLTVAT